MARAINTQAFVAAWNNHSIPVKRIAAALGVTHQAVSDRAHRMGLPTRAHVRMLKHDPALLREMWLAGVSVRAIANHFGLSQPSCASTAVRKAKLPPRERGPSGGLNGGWVANLPIDKFWEQKLALRMQVVADQDREAARTKNRVAA